MACFRLVTFFPDRPERSFPRFISCMALPTLFPAAFPYRRAAERGLLRVLGIRACLPAPRKVAIGVPPPRGRPRGQFDFDVRLAMVAAAPVPLMTWLMAVVGMPFNQTVTRWCSEAARAAGVSKALSATTACRKAL